MDSNRIHKILSTIDVAMSNSHFLGEVFNRLAKKRKKAQMIDGDNLKRVIAEEYEDLSERLDRTKIQESPSVRNVLRTRRLANLLINDKGELNLALLPPVITHLQSYLHSLGPNRQYDSVRQEHILKVLVKFQNSKELVRLLQSISKPHAHPLADQIIRDTLLLPHNVVITDAHARRAAFSALLCYLRQNVGSCFATAPAIIIQSEQQELFLTDIRELMATGRLKRTFGGIEYSVPLSFSWGAGDLRKLFVLSTTDKTQNTVWEAPGLVAAFEAAGLFSEDLPSTEKVQKTRELCEDWLYSYKTTQPYILASCEDVIKSVLMKHFSLTKDDVEAFEHRPKGMIHSSLLMQAHAGAGMGGKGEAVGKFYEAVELASSSFKALADNAFLKSWEFSLASFSETKAEFTRWNLYSSLGLGPRDPGGIGERLFEILKHKLDHWNQRVHDIQFEYETVFNQLKSLEMRIRSASSEREAQWIRIEYQTKTNEFRTLEDIRDEAHARASQFANMFDFLVHHYDRLFPEYFQEVYDADMHEVNVGPYDDSPAGFRLFYKHGRANTSQWTRIRNPTEFIDSLANFFVVTEREISTLPEMKDLENDVSDMVTGIVSHIRSKEFLETAFYRMAQAHKTPAIKDPLDNLDKIEKKPWAYTSGGTINTLLSCYYRYEQKPTSVSRWVENPMELMVFFADTLKQIPYKLTDEFRADNSRSMLMHSPTHAFLLKPGSNIFKQAWQTEAFTYTWVRDNLVKPMERFVDSIELNSEMMDYIINELAEQVPLNYRHYFKKIFHHMSGVLSPGSFRDYVLNLINKERGLMMNNRESVLTPDDIDSALYTLLPLFPRNQLQSKVLDVLAEIGVSPGDLKEIGELIDEWGNKLGGNSLVSAQGLQDVCLAMIALLKETTSDSVDDQGAISKAAQKLGYAMPAPILVADTNWVRDQFGFVFNPGSEQFEFWRIDCSGRVGRPMSSWKQWLNGSRKDIPWGIYTRPYEYH